MHTSRTTLFAAVTVAALVCATAIAPTGSAAPTAATPAPFSAQELDRLVAPVALYPDVVLDSLLPATVAPEQVDAAARHVAANAGVTSAPDGVAWDEGVVAMMQYPDVLAWMGENPRWVEDMGFALTTQQADVLAAVQRYRARARDAGVLESDEHVNVLVQPQSIVIVPAEPTVVYVPTYDPWLLLEPNWVYVRSRPFFTFWGGFSFGVWGPWAYHQIGWGPSASIYFTSTPWWWGRWRRSGGVHWGVERRTVWRPSLRADRPWNRTGWRNDANVTIERRPSSPTFSMSTRAGARTRTDVRPPTIRRRDGARTAPSPFTRPSRNPDATPRRITPTPGLLPGTRTPRTPTPAPRIRPRTETPSAPSIRPGRRIIDGWSERGRGSLEGRRTAPSVVPQPRTTPTPGIVPTPRAPTPRATNPPRIQRPRLQTPFAPRRDVPRATPSPSRIREWSDRGRSSLLRRRDRNDD